MRSLMDLNGCGNGFIGLDHFDQPFYGHGKGNFDTKLVANRC